MRSLRDTLEGERVDQTGGQLWSGNALGASADGTVIVGRSTNPNGYPEGYRAVLPLPTPHEAIGVLIGKVEASYLTRGQQNGLIRPLLNAQRSLDRGKRNPACSQVTDFIQGVRAKTPTPLDDTTGAEWILGAEYVLYLIGCD